MGVIREATVKLLLGFILNGCLKGAPVKTPWVFNGNGSLTGLPSKPHGPGKRTPTNRWDPKGDDNFIIK
ncbi:hypothetical protein DPMN_071228 [Dreissena polymorpha]|uniref:Secreted protein n=1 Tax=Dreissena polymorpha TaxID=45954 RepID=A0A9D3Z268_DREPO|nr:hypothetical protein DPMN_071226 [Dreissena polymorpha]KAH3711557.1 hypothetical protein DPMN_071228 [Dreissena polymorpha]